MTSQAEWAGPYFRAEDGAGRVLDWEPLAGGKPPRDAVRFIVRWRVSGFSNPRKRTFADPVQAAEWGRRIAAAAMLKAARDDKGWPLLDRPDGDVAAQPVAAPAATGIRRSDRPDADAADSGRLSPRPPAAGPSRSDTGTKAETPELPVAVPAGSGELGADVDSYIDELIRAYRPYWEQTNQDRWWLDQLAFVRAVFRYPEGDPRLAQHGLAAGASIHFALLHQGDLNRALHTRRTTNLQSAQHNRQRRERYERLMAEYEAKLAAWKARRGHRGRKPKPPAPPKVERESSEEEVLISANTENRFRTVLSFVFDRAFDAGLFPPGPNPYRTWNPRGAGGRRAQRRSPFRSPERWTADARDYPGLGFWVDLGDVLASKGDIVTPAASDADAEVRTGERYRILPLTMVQLAPRPGEGRRLRDEHFHPDQGRVVIEPEQGGHLKQREPGELRYPPLGALVAGLVRQHVAGGLAGPDGTLFLSPNGFELDLTNFYDDFLRPAIALLCGPEGPWPVYPSLQNATLYDTRKAGITLWVAYGADTLEAANWSGHTEHELLRSYRGVIAGRGRRANWAGIDATVEQALRDDPPRGDGLLARYVRDWLSQ